MKYTIEGFSQQVLVEYGLDAKDAIFIRWFVDFMTTGKMEYRDDDNGNRYYWIDHETLARELPILRLNDMRSVKRFIADLVELNALSRIVVKLGPAKGSKAYYMLNQIMMEKLVNNIHTGDKNVPSTGDKNVPSSGGNNVPSDSSITDPSIIDSSINKLYISSDEDISLEQAQPITTTTSSTKKINKTKNIKNTEFYLEIERYYKNIYTGTFGRAPIINYGRVRKQIKSILNSGATVEQIKDAISKALADDWVMQGGFNIETILSAKTFNRVLNNPYKTDCQKSYSKEPYDEDEEFRRLEADLYTNDPAYKEWQELKRKKASGELDREFEEHRAEWEAFKEKMRSAK